MGCNIVPAPGLHEDLRLPEIGEDLPCQRFVPEPGIEAFAVGDSASENTKQVFFHGVSEATDEFFARLGEVSRFGQCPCA